MLRRVAGSAGELQVLGVTYVFGAAAILFLAFWSSRRQLDRPMAIAFGTLFGLAAGTIYAVRDITSASLFGRTALGSIESVGVGLGTASSGLGPFFFGFCRDRLRNYDAMVWGLGYAVLAAALLLLVAPAPVRLEGQREGASASEVAPILQLPGGGVGDDGGEGGGGPGAE